MQNPPSDLMWIERGNITSPSGFSADAIFSGVKTYGEEPKFDLGILLSEDECTVAGVFTQNSVTGWPVQRSRELLAKNTNFKGLIVNSGNANTMTGPQGKIDGEDMCIQAATLSNTIPSKILNASTGVIGRRLPMATISTGIQSLQPSASGGHNFARSIMTTDTKVKEGAIRFSVANQEYIIGGCAKGSGMIHPNMATMFGFITTDANVDPSWMQDILKVTVDQTFNMLDIDMDTSTSDTVLMLASQKVGSPIDDEHPAAGSFKDALYLLSEKLVRDLAADGEGATSLIQAQVKGTSSLQSARNIARTIVSSPLIKTMVTGNDPNWGRVLMAIGRAESEIDTNTISVNISGTTVFENGAPRDIDLNKLSQSMDTDEVIIDVAVGNGIFEATAWGCNLTDEYVHINADYTT